MPLLCIMAPGRGDLRHGLEPAPPPPHTHLSRISRHQTGVHLRLAPCLGPIVLVWWSSQAHSCLGSTVPESQVGFF